MSQSSNRINVLILGCGTQGLVMARSLKKSGYGVYLFGGKNNYADSSRYVDRVFYVSTTTSSPEYLQEVLKVVLEYGIDTMIPMGDTTSEFISKNIELLKRYVKVQMPCIEDFTRATDKNKLMSLCEEKGYPHPLTINTIDNIHKVDKATIPFPLLIKPNITCGARGMTLVNSYVELLVKLPEIQAEYGGCHLQKYVRPGGAQVEVQLFVNERQELVNSSVIYKYRWYPEKGGSSCCAKSVRNDRIVDILYHLLLDLNWVGFADFDTIEDPDTGELLILELNPRVPACVKCAFEAGINWGEVIVNAYLGLPQKHYEYRENEFLRHLGFEVLWFLKSPNRFKTRPNWFHLIGRHIHYQDMSDWTDPIPFFAGSFRNLCKVLRHQEKTKIEM